MPTKLTSTESRPTDREHSPPLGAWWRLYALVIGADVAIIVLLTILTRSFD